MHLLEDKNEQELPHQTCVCQICLYKPKNTQKAQLSDIKTPNQLHSFIKFLPPSLPIMLEHTLLLEHKQPQIFQYHSYSNYLKDEKRKWIMNHQMVRSIHAINTQNITLYYKFRQKIMPRFEAVALLSNMSSTLHSEQLLYIQPYQHRPVVRVHFLNQKRPLKDDLLIEYLRKEEERFKSNSYKPNEQFFEWVHTEYGETTFCNFLTELYVRLFKTATNHSINNAIFYWVLQPIKNDIAFSKSGARAEYQEMQIMSRPKKLSFKPKLANVRNLQINFYEKLYSFQEEYSELIKKRIYSSSKKHISAIKNKAYRSRLQHFREKLQNVYHQEQQTVLSRIEPQKAFEFEQDSQKMARLLVPNLPKNQTLREVLSDQKAFRLLISKPKHRRLMTQTSKPTQNVLASLQLQKPKKMVRNNTLQAQLPNMQSVQRRFQKILKTPSTQDKND